MSLAWVCAVQTCVWLVPLFLLASAAAPVAVWLIDPIAVAVILLRVGRHIRRV